jgi:hypothetical protein
MFHRRSKGFRPIFNDFDLCDSARPQRFLDSIKWRSYLEESESVNLAASIDIVRDIGIAESRHRCNQTALKLFLRLRERYLNWISLVMMSAAFLAMSIVAVA